MCLSICKACNSDGNVECPGMAWCCGLSIHRVMILIDVLGIREKRESRVLEPEGDNF